MSGKSTMIARLLEFKEDIFSAKFVRIIYSLPKSTLHLKSDYLSIIRQYVNNLEIIEGIPAFKTLGLDLEPQFPKLLIVEDQQSAVYETVMFLQMLCHDSHHTNTS